MGNIMDTTYYLMGILCRRFDELTLQRFLMFAAILASALFEDCFDGLSPYLAY